MPLSADLIFVLLPFLLRLLIVFTFDLGVDEAHYMLYARYLDLSYFDHPPLVGWVHFLFNSALGENLLSARLPAMLLGVYVSFQVLRFLKNEGYSQPATQMGTLAFGLCFQFFVLFLFLLPDTLTLALVWPLMQVTARLSQKPTWQDWISLGLLMGLMGLAKYTGIFFVVPVAYLLLNSHKWRLFKKFGLYLSLALAFALITPVLLWNAKNDWISFKYQLGHVLSQGSGFINILESLASQFAIYSPFLWPLSLFGFYRLWKSPSPQGRFALVASFTFAAFFIYSAWSSPILPHWPALFYLFTIPYGVAYIWETRTLWAKLALYPTAVVIFGLAFLLASGLAYKIPGGGLKEVTGWPLWLPEVSARLKEPQQSMALTNWTYGSRALFYLRGLENKIFILDDRKDQFDLWNSQDWTSKDLLVVQFSYDHQKIEDILKCDRVSAQERIPILRSSAPQYEVLLQWCFNAVKK